MKYLLEKNFIMQNMKDAYNLFVEDKGSIVTQKTEFDLVTDLDCSIEKFLIDKIRKTYPADNILSEEFLSDEKVQQRTWVIDPIDGTCNFAHGMLLFGIQCALFENDEVVMSAIYLPNFKEEYFAIKEFGAYLNNKKINVNSNCSSTNAIASFGDYTHKNLEYAKIQNQSIYYLQSRIAKIRMFGAACLDFSYVASGKTDATVVMTRNLWDIAPGILLCKEAGGIVTNVNGGEYTFEDFAVVISCSNNLSKLMTKSFNNKE